jgi:hypothetical protein
MSYLLDLMAELRELADNVEALAFEARTPSGSGAGDPRPVGAGVRRRPHPRRRLRRAAPASAPTGGDDEDATRPVGRAPDVLAQAIEATLPPREDRDPEAVIALRMVS